MNDKVQQVIDELVESGAERGVQVAVYRHGEPVVDAVAGIADPATGREVTSGTVFYNYSIGKGATSTVLHTLAERGVLDYDTPVAELWPEFAAHGKDKVTIRHVLTHSAGVPGLPQDTTIERLCDWDSICTAIADAELWWEPGAQVGYHAYTFGYIVGEVVRRATGRRISEVLRDEVTGPLGVADELYLGMPASEHGRLAPLQDVPGAAEMMASLPPDLPMFKAGPPAIWPDAAFGNRTDVLEAEIPAGAKTSARAIAKMYAGVMGHIPGVNLVSPERLREITKVAAQGTDQVYGNESVWGLGYTMATPGGSQREGVLGYGGMGGSFAFGDMSTGITFALTKNVLSPDFETSARILQVVMDQ